MAYGIFEQDGSGLWHYRYMSTGYLFQAAADAIQQKPDEPSWFWFNDTPAPMHEGDTNTSLMKRWADIRDIIQKGSAIDAVKALTMQGSASISTT